MEDTLTCGSSCIAYFKFNGDFDDSCNSTEVSMSAGHGSAVTQAGKMGNGLI